MDNIQKKGISYFDFNSADYKGLLDPDNVFWAAIKNHRKDSDFFIGRNILSLYETTKDRLDRELNDFRFSADLSAIYIDPTDRCNANCPYCYVPANLRRNGTQMTKRQLAYILKKIAAQFKGRKKKIVIVFHASEPLLVKDIIFWAIKNFDAQFHFGLQTNATLLTKEDVEFLKKYRVGIGISLDSFNPKVNNRLRINKDADNFKQVLKAIEWFNGYEGLNVITTITKFNVRDLPGLVKFLHAKKVPCVLLNPVRLTQKNSRRLKPYEKIMAQYFIKAVDTALELSKTSKRRIIIGNFANVILAIVSPDARRLMCDISPCGAGRCFFTITASGEMIPCGEFIGLKGFSGGNIFRNEIPEAMASAPFKKIRSRVVENIAECDTCTFRNICGAPCPAELYSLGNMHQRAVFCDFYKEIIRYAFRLIAAGREKYCFRDEGFKNFEYEYCLGRSDESSLFMERRQG